MLGGAPAVLGALGDAQRHPGEGGDGGVEGPTGGGVGGGEGRGGGRAHHLGDVEVEGDVEQAVAARLVVGGLHPLQGLAVPASVHVEPRVGALGVQPHRGGALPPAALGLGDVDGLGLGVVVEQRRGQRVGDLVEDLELLGSAHLAGLDEAGAEVAELGHPAGGEHGEDHEGPRHVDLVGVAAVGLEALHHRLELVEGLLVAAQAGEVDGGVQVDGGMGGGGGVGGHAGPLLADAAVRLGVVAEEAGVAAAHGEGDGLGLGALAGAGHQDGPGAEHGAAQHVGVGDGHGELHGHVEGLLRGAPRVEEGDADAGEVEEVLRGGHAP